MKINERFEVPFELDLERFAHDELKMEKYGVGNGTKILAKMETKDFYQNKLEK